MIKRIIIIMLILSSFSLVYAQELNDSPESGEETTQGNGNEGLTHAQVILAPALSAALTLAFMIEDALFNITEWGNTELWIKRGTLFSIHLPLYTVSILPGLIISGVSAGCYATYEVLEDQNADFFRDFFYTGIFQAGLFSTYLAYSGNRVKAQSGIYYNDWRQETFAAKFSDDLGVFGSVYKEWKPYSFFDLFISPFKAENFLDPMVGILSIAGIISPLIRRSHDSAPWRTGKMYAGTMQMNPFAALSLMLAFFFIESSIVSISEESHFRGFLYEEIGSNYGHIPAKIVDGIYFPAIHIPQEVFIAEFDAWTITRNFLSRAVLTFYMDNLYDRGGLERTVAAHFWIDFTLLFTQWLLVSGEPQEDVSAILELLPEIQIQIPLDY